MDGWIQFACLYAVIRISVEIFVLFLSQGQVENINNLK